MSKSEANVEKEIADWCEKNKVLFIKFNPFGSRGWPDRIAVFPTGLHAWIELKKKGKTPRKLQLHRMAQLAFQGCLVEWFDNSEDCIVFLQECLDAIVEADAPPEPPEPPVKPVNPVYPH